MGLDPKCLAGSQDYGNCTSWAIKYLINHVLGTEIAALGEFHQWIASAATCITYGGRGSSGQGMSLMRAVQIIRDIAIAFMIKYDSYDLRDEDTEESLGNRWGRSGVPDKLIKECQGERMTHVLELEDLGDMDTVKDLLFGGAGLIHGSQLTGTTNGKLVSGLKRIGGHAQALVGYDDTEEFQKWYRDSTGKPASGTVYINLQSWGNWNNFDVSLWPDHLWGERPQGAWMLWEEDQRTVHQNWGNVFAISKFEGLVSDVPDWKSIWDSIL
jgi:hypothetical protein